MQYALPSLTATSQALWPVWSGSTASPVKWVPTTRKHVSALYHRLQEWDRTTHDKHRHGGIVGVFARVVYETLAFEFLNCRTGRCDPSLDQIAAKAAVSRRTVVKLLRRLRDLGVLTWIRRCEPGQDEAGRFQLRQRTNAYFLCPVSQWKGYRGTDPPPPTADTLGAPTPVPEALEAAAEATVQGDHKAQMAALTADPDDALALALAELIQLKENWDERQLE